MSEDESEELCHGLPAYLPGGVAVLHAHADVVAEDVQEEQQVSHCYCLGEKE